MERSWCKIKDRKQLIIVQIQKVFYKSNKKNRILKQKKHKTQHASKSNMEGADVNILKQYLLVTLWFIQQGSTKINKETTYCVKFEGFAEGTEINQNFREYH